LLVLFANLESFLYLSPLSEILRFVAPKGANFFHIRFISFLKPFFLSTASSATSGLNLNQIGSLLPIFGISQVKPGSLFPSTGPPAILSYELWRYHRLFFHSMVSYFSTAVCLLFRAINNTNRPCAISFCPLADHLFPSPHFPPFLLALTSFSLLPFWRALHSFLPG